MALGKMRKGRSLIQASAYNAFIACGNRIALRDLYQDFFVVKNPPSLGSASDVY
jgi:hypothetical protein